MATHDHAIVDAMRRRVVQLEVGEIVRDQSRGVYGSRAPSGEARDAISGEPDAAEPKVEVEVNGEAGTESQVAVPTGDDPAPTAEFEVWTESRPSAEA